MASHIFTTHQLNELYIAHQSLDGHKETLKDDKTGEVHVKVVPYAFGADGKGSGKLRYAIVKNLAILKRHHDDYLKTQDGIILTLSGGTGRIAETDTELIGRLNKEVQEVLNQQVTVEGLFTISWADLNMGGNPSLPASVVAVLEPLLTE